MSSNQHPVIWIHCASLGEFEQGRPVMESLRKEFPDHRLLLSFFSPSGYEVRKNYSGADFVFYLPIDTPNNARRWLEVTRPSLAIFVKYEFWPNYSAVLHQMNIPAISISGIFREDQAIFKWYGGVLRQTLRSFDHFFVQTQQSKELLASVGLTNTTLSGDTRFDRVKDLSSQTNRFEIIEKFKDEKNLMVVGSAWPEDMNILAPFINETKLKFIIAPHEISEEFLQEIESSLDTKALRYSGAAADEHLENYRILLIDNIGMLSALYRYGEFAFVGGAFGKGLHNILEAACYGMPLFFGNQHYQKFNEANELIMRGGAFAVSDLTDLKEKYQSVTLPENFLLACEVTRAYVLENTGATEKIMEYCRKILNP